MKRLFYTIAILFAWFQMAAQSYTYDNLNRLTCVEYANGVTVTYTYDALGNRLRQVVNAAQAPAIRGDVNGDGVVDVDDLNIVINIMIRKATMERWPAADLDGNGVVDVDDLNHVINIMIRKE